MARVGSRQRASVAPEVYRYKIDDSQVRRNASEKSA